MSHSGETVSNYRILEPIGRGGMGVVYKALDQRLGRSAAVKFLPRQLTEDPEARQRFLLEARAASTLEHPNVCPVYEAGETDEGQLYIAMAFYEGETLAQRIRRGRLDLDEALRLAAQVCRGLSRAHHQGIVHRDIKPANVMLSAHGEAKIVDFGLALLGEEVRLTRDGSTLGTPAYMPPEQIRGEEVDARADVWAVGVLLFEMLTAELPFAAGHPSGMVHAILNEPPRRLRELRPELPAELDSVVARALSKDRDSRYQTVDELLTDLVALRESGELVTLIRQAPRGRSGARRIGAVVAVALVLAALLAYWAIRRPAGPRRAAPGPAAAVSSTVAVLPFTVRGGPDYQYLGGGMVDLLGTKLDGAGGLRSVDSHALLGFVGRQPEELSGQSLADRVAESFAAELYVIGEILEIGGRLRLSASLYRRGASEPLSRAVEEGEAAEIFELVDHLAAILAAELVSGPGAELSRIAAVTTDSLPALKLYLAGEGLFRAGRFPQALEAFQAAVEEDPQFALAWYRLSVAAEWASRTDLLDLGASRAAQLSDRLSEHNRRLLEARLISRQGRVGEAERLYQAILESYPEDVEAWLQLAELQIHYGPLDGRPGADSRQSWERVLELEPENATALWHLVRIVAYAGDLAALDEAVERLLALNPDSNRALEIEAIRAYTLADREEQRRVLEGLSGASSEVVALAAWNVAIATREVTGVQAILQHLADPARAADVQAIGHAASAYSEVARGRIGRAREQLAAASRLAPGVTLAHEALIALMPFLPGSDSRLEELQRRLTAWDAPGQPAASNPTIFFSSHDDLHPHLRLYLLGSIAARLGRDTALDRAAEIEQLPIPERLEVWRAALAGSVRALRYLEREGPQAALEALGSTHAQVSYQDVFGSPFLSRSLERYLRAELLAELGRLEEAIRGFSSFAELSFWDLAFLAPAAYRRAQLHEQLGREAEARASYEEFLRLWAEADPELAPWIEQAESRVAALAARRAG